MNENFMLLSDIEQKNYDKYLEMSTSFTQTMLNYYQP